MAVETIGFSPSQTLPKNSLLRLTFGLPSGGFLASNDILAPVGAAFGKFPPSMSRLWGDLPAKAGVFPTTPANVTPNSTTATIDGRIHADRTGAAVITAIGALADNFVELKRAELLTPAQVAVANTDVGALARDAAAKTEAAKAAADSWWTKITTGLTLGGTTVKLVAVAVILVVLLVAYSKVER